VGDTIHLGKRTLRVIGKRDDDADQPPVLIVEDQRPRGLCPMRRVCTGVCTTRVSRAHTFVFGAHG
jgi:hypothetical protein